jgi:chromosome segregation ATPase
LKLFASSTSLDFVNFSPAAETSTSWISAPPANFAYFHTSSRMQTLDLEISELESEIRKTQDKIKDIENLQIRIDKLETNQKASEESDRKILEKVQRFENILNEQIQSKSSELEEKVSELSLNFNILMNSVDDLERASKIFKCQLEELYNQNLKCRVCNKF